MRQFTMPFAAVSALLLAGCASPVVPTEHILTGPFRTDRASYAAVVESSWGNWTTYGFDVVTSFTNVTGDTLLLARCMPTDTHPMYAVFQLEPAGGTSGYDPTWACVGGVSPIVVAPGEVRVDSLHLAGPVSFDETTNRAIGSSAGTYAIGFQLSCAPAGSCTIADSQSTSTPFTVTHDQ